MGNDLQVVPVSKTRTSAENTSRAAFMHGEYSLTSQWLISAGLRKATVMGVELEASARLADHWDLHGSFGYTDASYDEFKSDQNNDGILDDVSSNDFINTPKLNYSIGLGFHQTVGALALESRLDYTWQDDVEFNTFNDVNRQNAYGLLNGRVTLSGDDRRWEVAIFGTNLTNQRYASFGITSEPYRIVYPGAPRLYGLDVRYRIL